MELNVGQFFDALSGDYAASIERCFPRYREMLWALLQYLPRNPPVHSIVELGCGTGNLSVLAAAAFPQAAISLIDLSPDSLEVCRSRLGEDARFTFIPHDMRKVSIPDGSVDLVVSSIAIHHLTANEKQKLFGQVRCWLSPHGTFTFADQFRGATPELYRQHIHEWRELAMAAGSTENDWNMWMQHQAEHDHHDRLLEQVDWLRAAGFKTVDCVWRFLLWSVVQARIE